jgi:hypothetical protein
LRAAAGTALELVVAYHGETLEVMLVRGSIKTTSLDPDKVVFKATDPAQRLYEAGTRTNREGARAPQVPEILVFPQVIAPSGKPRPPR